MNGKRILVIEDNPQSAVALTAMIERRGGIVDRAETMEEAEVVVHAHAFEQAPVDVIVADLCLPTTDAMATLLRLKKLGTPFCVVTGLSTPDVVEECSRMKVRLVLKGTSPVGIMEAVYYTLAQADPGYLHRASKEIIRDRRRVREIPTYSAAWFFSNWPNWVKYAAGVGTILATLTATATLGGTIYGWVNDHAAAPVIALQHVKDVDRTLDDIKVEQKADHATIQTEHDDQIKIFERLGSLDKQISEVKADTKQQLDRIEAKIDRR